MTTTDTILEGYPIQTHPADRYRDAFLYVRGRYVHQLIVSPDGRVLLQDADHFDGPRTTLTIEEQATIAALYRQLSDAQTTKRHTQHARQRDAARQALQRVADTLAGMDDVQIYD